MVFFGDGNGGGLRFCNYLFGVGDEFGKIVMEDRKDIRDFEFYFRVVIGDFGYKLFFRY